MSPILLPIKEFISQNNVREADNLIIELQKRNDLKLIGELLELLDDNCKYDELMYSIIHATETMEDSAFVNNFLERAEDLLKTSPKWAGVLLIRIVNNKNTNSL